MQKGTHHSIWSIRQNSISNKGKQLGENNPMFGRTSEKSPHFGKPKSEAHKNKIRLGNIGKQGLCGELNPNWRGGTSFLPYCSKFNFQKREEIREKYGRKCFLCDKSELENGIKKLSVHHIDYDKEQGCNGKTFELVPLCGSCHSKSGRKREQYRTQIITKLKIIEV